MLRKVIIVLITTFIILGCEQATSEIIKEVTTINNISIIWKGSLSSAPSNLFWEKRIFGMELSGILWLRTVSMDRMEPVPRDS